MSMHAATGQISKQILSIKRKDLAMFYKSLLVALSLSVAALPSGVLALSCSQNNGFDVIEHVLAQGADYRLIAGYPQELERSGSVSLLDLETLPAHEERSPSRVRMRIIGGQYSADGEISYGQYEYDLTLSCTLSWCGRAPRSGKPRLFILKDDGGRLSGISTACGGSDLPMPTQAQSEAIKHCMAHGKCDPDHRVLWED